MKPTWGLEYWTAFLAAVSLLFLPAELIALFTNSANTLSDFSWYELGVNGTINHHTWPWWLSLVSVILGFGVLVGHIWFRTPG